MMRWTTRISAAAALSLVLVSTAAVADNVTQARTYFNAGAQAYEAGQFLAAIQAFEQAYAIAPRDAIVFTIGQAYRRQYYIDKNPAHLREAIDRYRDYLRGVAEGGRRADAAQALAELEPIAARLAATEEGLSGASPAASRETRLMITSPTEGATISLDGKPPADLPLIAKVPKGKHRIVVSAPGYFDEVRDVEAVQGSMLALDLALREKPGALYIVVEPDAQISVDGRLVGASPLSAPLELPAGDHLVAVMKNGRVGYSVEVDLERGKKRRLIVDLESTGQRVASNVLFVGSAGALITGGVFTALAIGQENKAQNIEAEVESDNISGARLREYNDTIDRRDDYRMAAGVSFGATIALGATGLLLYSFDQPSLSQASGQERKSRPTTETSPSEPSMDFGMSPVWSPGWAGVSAAGRF